MAKVLEERYGPVVQITLNRPEVRNAKGKVAMTGGVAKSKGMVRALEEKLGITLNISEEPQIAGAMGAALIACEKEVNS